MGLSQLTPVSGCLAISICSWSKAHSPKREEEESLCVWQAPRQSWIIYLFCNSFLSNILFLSLVIKNWNASFSVDDLILTICLTLDTLFNLCSWMSGQCLTQRRRFTRVLTDFHLRLWFACFNPTVGFPPMGYPAMLPLLPLGTFYICLVLTLRSVGFVILQSMLFHYGSLSGSSLEYRDNGHATARLLLNAFEICRFFIYSMYSRSFPWATISHFFQLTVACAISSCNKQVRS